jgi:hypothetical protein
MPGHSKKISVCSWCLSWLALLSSDVERMGFYIERTAVRVLRCNSKPSFLTSSSSSQLHAAALLIGEQPRHKFAHICCMFRSCFRIYNHVPYERLNLPSSLVFIDDFNNCIHFFICATCGGTIWECKSWTEVSPCLNPEKHWGVYVLTIVLSPKVVLSI